MRLGRVKVSKELSKDRNAWLSKRQKCLQFIFKKVCSQWMQEKHNKSNLIMMIQKTTAHELNLD